MEYTFNFKRPSNGDTVSYQASDTLDESVPAYMAFDCGNDLIDKFKAYYELSYKKEIPRPHLFLVNSSVVNAFAVYEKILGE